MFKVLIIVVRLGAHIAAVSSNVVDFTDKQSAAIAVDAAARGENTNMKIYAIPLF